MGTIHELAKRIRAAEVEVDTLFAECRRIDGLSARPGLMSGGAVSEALYMARAKLMEANARIVNNADYLFTRMDGE